MNWYYASHGTQQGPASEEQLAQLVREGAVSGSTLIWQEGMADWLALSVVRPDLLANSNAAPQIGGAAIDPAQKDLVVQQMREGLTPSTPGNLNYAGFWIRLVAKFIDGMILAVPLIGLFLILIPSAFQMDVGQSTEPTPEQLTKMIVNQLLMSFVQIALSVSYNAITIAKWGATLGKMAVGLKVVDAEGNPISTGKSWGRAFADILSGMVCWIGYIIIAFDEQKRGLHDHICNTRVIKTR